MTREILLNPNCSAIVAEIPIDGLEDIKRTLNEIEAATQSKICKIFLLKNGKKIAFPVSIEKIVSEEQLATLPEELLDGFVEAGKGQAGLPYEKMAIVPAELAKKPLVEAELLGRSTWLQYNSAKGLLIDEMPHMEYPSVPNPIFKHIAMIKQALPKTSVGSDRDGGSAADWYDWWALTEGWLDSLVSAHCLMRLHSKTLDELADEIRECADVSGMKVYRRLDLAGNNFEVIEGSLKGRIKVTNKVCFSDIPEKEGEQPLYLSPKPEEEKAHIRENKWEEGTYVLAIRGVFHLCSKRAGLIEAVAKATGNGYKWHTPQAQP